MIISTPAPVQPAVPVPPSTKPLVMDTSSLLIKVAAQPDFSQIEQMPRGAARKQAAYDALVATAAASQGPAIELAERLKNEGAILGYETLVSPNMVVVKPASGKNMVVANAFHALAGVGNLYENRSGSMYQMGGKPFVPPSGPGVGLDVIGPPTEVKSFAPPQAPYGLGMIGAQEAWAAGAEGEGLVYGSIDTGADPSHEALAAKYRGTAADGSVSHDYNWFDPTGKVTAAKDFDTHGTHTIGTVLGDGVGVAPKAKFISAAGVASGATPGGLLKSIQWMQAPTKVDGSAPDATRAPDVVGMSWWTGPVEEDLFLESMRNLRAAGIEPVKSAGNKGPGRGTISSPGQYPELIATAAVDSGNKIASFSSRGPAPYPKGSSTPKPDFAMPGVDVVSTLPGNRYGKMSGTSMAQPHMSGAILGILSKYPQLTHDQLYAVLREGATDGGAPGFDAEFGHGTINLGKSLAAAAKLVG